MSGFQSRRNNLDAVKNRRTLIPLKYGESVLSESRIFENGSPDKYLKIDFIIYLIDTGKKKILIDAGCDVMPGFEMTNWEKPSEVLKQHGYDPNEITDVIITHAHRDHIAAVNYYNRAVIHIQEDEYVSGKKYIPDDFTVICFSDDYAIDEGVEIIKIGGHSCGSCIVKFDIDGKEQVIIGDECYHRECLIRHIPTGSSCCPEKSRAFIEEYSKPQYTVWLCHDQ